MLYMDVLISPNWVDLDVFIRSSVHVINHATVSNYGSILMEFSMEVDYG